MVMVVQRVGLGLDWIVLTALENPARLLYQECAPGPRDVLSFLEPDLLVPFRVSPPHVPTCSGSAEARLDAALCYQTQGLEKSHQSRTFGNIRERSRSWRRAHNHVARKNEIATRHVIGHPHLTPITAQVPILA